MKRAWMVFAAILTMPIVAHAQQPGGRATAVRPVRIDAGSSFRSPAWLRQCARARGATVARIVLRPHTAAPDVGVARLGCGPPWLAASRAFRRVSLRLTATTPLRSPPLLEPLVLRLAGGGSDAPADASARAHGSPPGRATWEGSRWQSSDADAVSLPLAHGDGETVGAMLGMAPSRAGAAPRRARVPSLEFDHGTLLF